MNTYPRHIANFVNAYIYLVLDGRDAYNTGRTARRHGHADAVARFDAAIAWVDANTRDARIRSILVDLRAGAETEDAVISAEAVAHEAAMVEARAHLDAHNGDMLAAILALPR